jgi:hypothetical protein
MLKKVSKSRALWIFIFGAYMVQHGGHHNWGGIVLVHDHMKSVVQGKFLEFDFSLSSQRKDYPSKEETQQKNFFHSKKG